MEYKYGVGEIVEFVLTNQKVMILELIHRESDKVFSAPFDGYLVRFDSLQEIPVREFELSNVSLNTDK